MAPVPARKRDLTELGSFRFGIVDSGVESHGYIIYLDDLEQSPFPGHEIEHLSTVDLTWSSDPVGLSGSASEHEEPWVEEPWAKFEEARSRVGFRRELRDLEHKLTALLLKWPAKEREKEHEHTRSRYLYGHDELAQIFNASVDRWREETGMLPTIAQRAMHPDYLRIIGLGRQAIPLLLEELKQRPDHWFWALRAITGEDPTIPDSDFGEAVDAWLRWGEENGYAE